MKRSEAFPSKYLSKDDVQTPVVAVISHVVQETLKSDSGDETKPILYFSGEVKPMVLNNTNWMSIESLYGDDSEGWGGKKIELYFDPAIMFGNKRVGGVRVRPPSQIQELSYPEAIKYVFDQAGLSEDDLKAYLTEHGRKGYAPKRDTALVMQLVQETQDAAEEIPLE